MRLVVSAEVAERIATEAEWYELRKPGLGNELVVEVERAVARIERHPLGPPAIHRRFRQYKLDRFPFHLIYRATRHEIVILRMFHSVGDPRKKFRGLRKL